MLIFLNLINIDCFIIFKIIKIGCFIYLFVNGVRYGIDCDLEIPKIYLTCDIGLRLGWLWNCLMLRHDNENSLWWSVHSQWHYNDVMMSAMASQITGVTIVYSTFLLWRRSKKTSKIHVTGLCERNSPVTGEFPAQKASKAENVSIWWRIHRICHSGGHVGNSLFYIGLATLTWQR